MAPPDALVADGFVLEQDPAAELVSDFVYREEHAAAQATRWHSSRMRRVHWKPRRGTFMRRA
jgi:hypothetical protein